jgi:hypothetical protein
MVALSGSHIGQHGRFQAFAAQLAGVFASFRAIGQNGGRGRGPGPRVNKV